MLKMWRQKDGSGLGLTQEVSSTGLGDSSNLENSGRTHGFLVSVAEGLAVTKTGVWKEQIQDVP